MLYTDFIKCLTSGNWMLRGHSYRFLSPAMLNTGYFTVDGLSDSQLNFEVTFENGLMYLYLNIDREEMPEERYRILTNYCLDKISMLHEMRKEDGSGYELPSMVFFEKEPEAVLPEKKGITWHVASKLHQLWRKTGAPLFKERDLSLGKNQA